MMLLVIAYIQSGSTWESASAKSRTQTSSLTTFACQQLLGKNHTDTWKLEKAVALLISALGYKIKFNDKLNNIYSALRVTTTISIGCSYVALSLCGTFTPLKPYSTCSKTCAHCQLFCTRRQIKCIEEAAVLPSKPIGLFPLLPAA